VAAYFRPVDRTYLLHGVHITWFRPRLPSKVPRPATGLVG
jgi:hypothetical protein